MKMEMKRCRKLLAMLWFIVCGLFFFVVVLQLYVRYRDYMNEYLEWLFPTIMPTLLLMVGVFAAEATSGATDTRMVERFFFHLTFGLSAAYLLVVALTIFVPPFVMNPKETVEFLGKSHLFLGPVQGLVSASIGVFFLRRA